jgi:hypothetical protein
MKTELASDSDREESARAPRRGRPERETTIGLGLECTSRTLLELAEGPGKQPEVPRTPCDDRLMLLQKEHRLCVWQRSAPLDSDSAWTLRICYKFVTCRQRSAPEQFVAHFPVFSGFPVPAEDERSISLHLKTGRCASGSTQRIPA